MDKKIFSNAMKLISFCSRLQMDSTTRLQIESLLSQPISWQTIMEESLYHEVLPLLYYNIVKLNKSNLPKNILCILKNSYYIALTRNISLWKEFCYLQDMFRYSGTKIIPLKGIILSKTLYPDIGLRPMVDIDILVREKDLRYVEKQILQLGYQKQLKNLSEDYWRKYQAHFHFRNPDKNIILELHWALASPRPNKLNLSDIWKRNKIQTIDNIEILTLTLEDTLISLILHICKNMPALQYLKLKNLCDIHELISQYNHKLDWEYIIEKIKSWNIRGATYYIYLLTKRYLQTTWPPDAIKTIAPHIAQRRLLILCASKLKPLPRVQTALLMLVMLDSLRDCLSLTIMGIQMFYLKNKLLILHSKTW